MLFSPPLFLSKQTERMLCFLWEFVLSPEAQRRLISHRRTPAIGQTLAAVPRPRDANTLPAAGFVSESARVPRYPRVLLLTHSDSSRGPCGAAGSAVPAPPSLPSQAVSNAPGAGSGDTGWTSPPLAAAGAQHSLRYSESTPRGLALQLGHTWGQGVAEGPRPGAQ